MRTHYISLCAPLALACLALATGCSMAGEGTSASSTMSGLSTSGASDSDGSDSNAATSGSTSDGGSDSASSSTGGSDGELCGNGAVDAGEVCDGDDLDGKACTDLGDSYVGGDLGCAPTCAAFDASGCEVAANAAAVKLNEFLAKGALEGDYAGLGDVIELYNAGAEAADLSGWQLSDELDFPVDKTYVFPEGSTLAPGAWLVLVEYDDVNGTGDFPFGVSSSNEETISLADAGGVVVDAVTFNGALAEVSYCRVADGDDAWQACLQTPGAMNVASDDIPSFCGDGVIDEGEACDGDALGGQTCVDLGQFSGGDLGCTDACTFDTTGCTSEMALVLNELSSADTDPIELLNAGDAAVDLSGWILTDDPTDPYDPELDDKELVFADGASLAAGAFLVIDKGDLAGQHPFGLGGGGDTVRLFNADLELVDSVTYGDTEADISYCRVPDGPDGDWTPGCTPTFGEPNQGP
ncbi:MAG: lamin tail domain-containing protein [Nannocystaceae bacterium]